MEESTYKEREIYHSRKYLAWSVVAFGIGIILMGYINAGLSGFIFLTSSSLAVFYSYKLIKLGKKKFWFMFILTGFISAVLWYSFILGLYIGFNS